MKLRARVLSGLLAATLAGCELQALNSFSSDAEQFTEVKAVEIQDAGDERFAAALGVIRDSCTSCHTHTHGFTSFSAEDEFLNNYYVTAGSAENSPLYTRMRGTEYGGIQDMPPDAAIADADITTIRDWILNIGVDDSVTDGSTSGESTKAQRTTAALAVISNHCASCHSVTKTAISTGTDGYSGQTVPAFGGYSSDAEFVQGGLADYGSSSTSWIIRALNGYGDIGTMPKSGSAISSDDYQTLTDWIDGMDED